jgi:hypothetical protein
MSKTRPNVPHPDQSQDALTTKLSQALNRAFTEGQLHTLDAAGKSDFAALIVERAERSTAPAWMAEAQTDDPNKCERVRESYERCLEIYRTMVRPDDTTYDDAGGAFAFFVAANLNALHDVRTTPDTLLLLERQLLGLVRQGSHWDTASISQRQFYFEQMAMLGVYIAGFVAKARAQGPAALAKAQDAARGYLRRVLGMNPDLLTFGEHGLALRPAPDDTPRTA